MFDIELVKSVYSELSSLIKTDLDNEFNKGRIKGSDYAKVYSQLIDRVLQLSFQAPDVAKDIELKQAQKDELIKNGQKERELKDIQIDLTKQEIILTQTKNEKEMYELDSILPAQRVQIELQNDEIRKKINAIDVDTTIKQQQSDKELEVKDAQIQLYLRQKQGFDDNLKQKLFEAQMGAWATMFNSGLLQDKPAVISNDEVSTLYNNMKTQLGIT